MGVTNGVNGSGNNFYIPGFWSKPNSNLEALKTEQKLSEPINLTSDNINIKREKLGFVNPYNAFDIDTSGMREIAVKSNEIMAKLGFPNYKVSPKTVASVSEGLNTQTIPALNDADNNAVAARVATPKGPFADLFA